MHCWDGKPDYCWYPYAKRELEAKGFEVAVPAFPDTDAPNLAKWLPVLKELAGEANEELFLIGHSVGCITILRYLETLGEGQKIGGAVLVAGFNDDLGFDELKNFFTTDLNLDALKQKANKFVAIHSDNDPFVPLKHGDTFKDKLGAELIVKHAMKHFSGPVDDEKSCLVLPDVVESVVKIAK